MSRLSSITFLFVLTAATATLYWATLDMPIGKDIIGVAAVVLIALSLVLERYFPFDAHWNRNRDDLSGDITSFVAVFVVLDGVLKLLAPFLVMGAIGYFGWPFGTATFAVPLWAEIIAVTLLIELGAYVSHRLHHHFRSLWSLHAMHHAGQRLYTLNNFRFHPINHIVNALFIILLPLLLGFSQQAVLGYVALSLPVLILQHANIDFKFGPLNYLLNTNEVHRWHHSTEQTEGNRNFGRALVVWDQLFGTFLFPRETQAPTTIGLSNGVNSSFPPASRFRAQLGYPFSAECCK